MRCTSCGMENPPGFSFCGHCGVRLLQPCPRCGLKNPAGIPFCARCGADLLEGRPLALRGRVEGERRFVVALFADIAGFTRLSERLDPEEVTSMVNRCLDDMTRAVVRYGGRVDKYTGDGLMAVFGAPVGHEDDPVRALRAALVMQERIAGVRFGPQLTPLALHIGAACGYVIAAEVGSEGRREYTVIGTAVNLAARLEEASTPGQTLVSEHLQRLAGHVFEFRPVLLPDVAGMEGPVRAFELLGERGQITAPWRSSRFRSPLVGRDEEMAMLEHCLKRLQQRQGQIVALVGEAGIGKSRLVDELRQRVEGGEMEVIWLQGHAVSHGQGTGYAPFREVIRAAVGAGNNADEDSLRERLQEKGEALFADRWFEIYPYLAYLLALGVEGPAAAPLQYLDGESLKWRIAQAVCDFIGRLCLEQPLVLVLEDMHWASPASLDLMERVLALTEERPLMVVVVRRPEAEGHSRHIHELVQQAHGHLYTEVRLQPLPEEAADELVCNMLGGGKVSPPVRRLLIFRGGGNPLFIEELVRSMVDQGLLVQQNGAWVLTCSEEEVMVPESVQGIIQARVDQLDTESRRVLQIAACIGRRFSLELLEAVAEAVGLSGNRLDQRLRTLEEAALVQEDGAGRGEYAFRHVLIRDAVHGGLLKEARTQIHTAVARWYEENMLDSPAPPYALLAYHYGQAENRRKQRFYLVKAGQEAAQRHANQEACDLFTQALDLTTDPEERFELLLARERVCDLMGDRAQQRAVLEEMLQLVDRNKHDRRRALAYNRLAAYRESEGDYPAARSAAEEGLNTARLAGDLWAEAESLRVLASVAWRQGRVRAALGIGQAALQVSRAAGDAAGEATSLTAIGLAHRTLGNYPSVRACYQQALDIRRAIGDRRGEAISLSQLGNVLCDQGDYTEAFDLHQQALDLFRLVGDRRGEAWSLSGLGAVYLACGDYEAARSCCEEALAIRRAIGDRRGEAVVLADMGRVLAATGDLEAARASLEQAVSVMRAIGARRDEVYSLTHLANVLERVGDLEIARSAHQVALSRRREQGQEAACLENVAGLARVALEQGELEAARAYAEEMLTHIRERGLTAIGSPFLAYQTCIRILQACGEEEEARTALEEAYRALTERAERLADPVLRRSFLEQVPEHREIVAAWKEMEGREKAAPQPTG